MTMDEDYFTICEAPEAGHDAECPICGEGFMIPYFKVRNARNQSICNLCAWEKAPALADLLYLSETVEVHGQGYIPTQISEALERRKNDPERLKKELRDAIKILGMPDNSVPDITLPKSPLAQLVAEQIDRAIEVGTVESMQHAKRLFEESKLSVDPGIPF